MKQKDEIVKTIRAHFVPQRGGDGFLSKGEDENGGEGRENIWFKYMFGLRYEKGG